MLPTTESLVGFPSRPMAGWNFARFFSKAQAWLSRAGTPLVDTIVQSATRPSSPISRAKPTLPLCPLMTETLG